MQKSKWLATGVLTFGLSIGLAAATPINLKGPVLGLGDPRMENTGLGKVPYIEFVEPAKYLALQTVTRLGGQKYDTITFSNDHGDIAILYGTVIKARSLNAVGQFFAIESIRANGDDAKPIEEFGFSNEGMIVHILNNGQGEAEIREFRFMDFRAEVLKDAYRDEAGEKQPEIPPAHRLWFRQFLECQNRLQDIAAL